jgi:hypothetical protein
VLVYGDHREVVDAGECLTEIAAQLQQADDAPPGIERHAKLVGALIDAGRLLQGVADRGDPPGELDLFVHRLARAVVRSFDSGSDGAGALPVVPALGLDGEVELRVPEGFAYYAVYPEAYIVAARRLRLSARPRVIGLRSIGTTLGAIVAATLGAPPALSVRPTGDPFARRIELPDAAIDRNAHYIIFDEGPGLSGSSFGGAADALEARGIPPERIAFLPSHGGQLGSHASEPHRRRWARAQRVAAEFDPAFLARRFGRLEAFQCGSGQERLKFVSRHGDDRVLLKFAGLGSIGESKFSLARALHAAGLTPEPLGLVHGFIAERWLADTRALQPGEKPAQEIGQYIGTRARLVPRDNCGGASIDELVAMVRRNVSLALGGATAERLAAADPAALNERVARSRTDNKMDRVEWLRARDGRLIKTDALDHHQAHDLIGCQDPAWDVAGAITEFELDRDATEALISATGLMIDRGLLDFYRRAYPAFRLGRAVLSGGREGRYKRALALLLEEHATREPAELLD